MSGYSQEKSFAVVAETRRKWSAAERKQIVAETEAASVSSVARARGRCKSGVPVAARGGCWGKKSARKSATAFVPVALPALTHVAQVVGADYGTIEIELGQGRRLRVSGPVEMEALRRVIAVLEGQ